MIRETKMSESQNKNTDDIKKNIANLKNELNADKFKKLNNYRKISGPNILIDMISSLIVGGFLGYIIDKYLQTLPLMLFVCLIFGMIGGVYNCYKNFKN